MFCSRYKNIFSLLHSCLIHKQRKQNKINNFNPIFGTLNVGLFRHFVHFCLLLRQNSRKHTVYVNRTNPIKDGRMNK